jgi:PTS system ascorbate-specific IIA component
MSVALFLITHEGIASNLIAVAEAVIKRESQNLSYTEVPMDADPALISEDIDQRIAKLDTRQGILFLTDIYGSSPSNIAMRLAEKHHAHMISGVNLPMIIRLLNYRDDIEDSLIEKAVNGAIKGIQDNF